MVFQPLKDTAECSFLSAINDVWSSTVLQEIGCQSTPPPSLSLTRTHTMWADTHIETRKHASMNPPGHKHITVRHVHRHTHELSTVWLPLTELALSIFLSYFFSISFAVIVCSFNVLPPDRKDLDSSPVHTNKRVRILLTACRSALPFMTAG